MIFWNSNFIEVPADYVHASPLEIAMFDPGYTTHRRYLTGARDHLSPDGRLLLGFSSMGSYGQVHRLAEESGYRVVVLTNEVRHVPMRVEYLLLEFVPLEVV